MSTLPISQRERAHSHAVPSAPLTSMPHGAPQTAYLYSSVVF
jgi:hypothetical protein